MKKTIFAILLFSIIVIGCTSTLQTKVEVYNPESRLEQLEMQNCYQEHPANFKKNELVMYLRKRVAMEQQRSKSPVSYIDYLRNVADELDPVRDTFVQTCKDECKPKKFTNITGLYTYNKGVKNYEDRFDFLKEEFKSKLEQIKRGFEGGRISLDDANKEILVVLTKYKGILSSLLRFDGKINEPCYSAIRNDKTWQVSFPNNSSYCSSINACYIKKDENNNIFKQCTGFYTGVRERITDDVLKNKDVTLKTSILKVINDESPDKQSIIKLKGNLCREYIYGDKFLGYFWIPPDQQGYFRRSYHDNVDEVISDPLLSIAEKDSTGWNSVAETSIDAQGKSDFVIIRETPYRFTVHSVKNDPSQLVRFNLDMAESTLNVVAKVASSYFGVGGVFPDKNANKMDTQNQTTGTASGNGTANDAEYTNKQLRGVVKERLASAKALNDKIKGRMTMDTFKNDTSMENKILINEANAILKTSFIKITDAQAKTTAPAPAQSASKTEVPFTNTTTANAKLFSNVTSNIKKYSKAVQDGFGRMRRHESKLKDESDKLKQIATSVKVLSDVIQGPKNVIKGKVSFASYSGLLEESFDKTKVISANADADVDKINKGIDLLEKEKAKATFCLQNDYPMPPALKKYSFTIYDITDDEKDFKERCVSAVNYTKQSKESYDSGIKTIKGTEAYIEKKLGPKKTAKKKIAKKIALVTSSGGLSH